MAEQYHTLTRSELRGFDTPSQDIILEMMAEGWEGRRSSGSHIQLKNAHAQGAVSASNKNNVNYLRQLRNRGVVRPATVSAVQQPAASRQKWPCPRCNKTFVDEASLSRHNNQDHEHLLPCPDCDSWHFDRRRLNLHRSKYHGYESPKKAQRLAMKAKRQERLRAEEPVTEPAPVEEPIAVVDEVPEVQQSTPSTPVEEWTTLDLSNLSPTLTVKDLCEVLQAAGLQVRIQSRER